MMTMIHMSHLQIVHHFLHVRQKLLISFIDKASHIFIAMPMYNLIEYNDSYSDASWSLWQFTRDKVPDNNVNLTVDNSQSFKYKVAPVGKTANVAGGNSFVKDTKIVVPLIYFE